LLDEISLDGWWGFNIAETVRFRSMCIADFIGAWREFYLNFVRVQSHTQNRRNYLFNEMRYNVSRRVHGTDHVPNFLQLLSDGSAGGPPVFFRRHTGVGGEKFRKVRSTGKSAIESNF
jgi:hypothetical protein